MEQIVRLGIKLIKIHPPHQLLYPNDYVNGVKELEIIYRAAEANGIPIMVHTGTSIFPGARNKYGDPMYVDDVAVDFPKLKILLAHGGRPLWMDTAFFLVRRHPNVLPRHQRHSAENAAEVFSATGRNRTQDAVRNGLAGTGRAGDREEPGRISRSATVSEATKEQILSKTALEIWPRDGWVETVSRCLRAVLLPVPECRYHVRDILPSSSFFVLLPPLPDRCPQLFVTRCGLWRRTE